MTKFNFFPKIDFLAYMKRIKIKYNPTTSFNDNCSKLIYHVENNQKKNKFVDLDYTLELIDYNEEPEVEIEMQNSKIFRFNPENYDISEMHRIIDSEQQQLHHKFMKTNLLENNEKLF